MEGGVVQFPYRIRILPTAHNPASQRHNYLPSPPLLSNFITVSHGPPAVQRHHYLPWPSCCPTSSLSSMALLLSNVITIYHAPPAVQRHNYLPWPSCCCPTSSLSTMALLLSKVITIYHGPPAVQRHHYLPWPSWLDNVINIDHDPLPTLSIQPHHQKQKTHLYDPHSSFPQGGKSNRSCSGSNNFDDIKHDLLKLIILRTEKSSGD